MAKSKRRNKPGRKSRAFAEYIDFTLGRTLLTLDELMSMKREEDPDAKPDIDELGNVSIKIIE